MVITRRIDFFLRNLFYRTSLKKYYICDHCKKIHRRKSDDLLLDENRGYIVSEECVYNLNQQVTSIILGSINEFLNDKNIKED